MLAMILFYLTVVGVPMALCLAGCLACLILDRREDARRAVRMAARRAEALVDIQKTAVTE